MESADGGRCGREVPGNAGRNAVAVVERDGRRLSFAPGTEVSDLRGGRWRVEGEIEAVEATVEAGVLRSETYPDPLARVS